MKKIIHILSILLVISLLLTGCRGSEDISTKKTNTNTIEPTSNILYTENGISYISKVDSKSFYIFKDGQWQKEFLKGVNMGVGVPGKFPGEMGITKQQYLRWFKYIEDMNANTIRVYTILSPVFYDAFYEYNQTAKNKLYLIQGLWINEEDLINYQNTYDAHIIDTFKEDAKSIIGILHGNQTLPSKKGHASGTYTKDISSYVIGLILGIEIDADVVNGTNSKNPTKTSFNGKYLYTQNASAYETFQTEVGDFAISYETSTYKTQKPIGFANWVTTDMMTHNNEPFPQEDSASVNPEHIKATKDYVPGLFASYHIYPYYPDFLNWQPEYITFKNKDGKIDNYKAYLADLIKQHDMPVLVAEYGVPSSRGLAHHSIMGFDQGMLTEQEQGDMGAYMLQDIYDEGYAGAILFTWQDEWFKRSWNTADYDIPDRRAYWSNTQTSEQSFGVLAFDPGRVSSVSYVDGDLSEWNSEKPLASGSNLSVCVKHDEKFLYLKVDAKNFDIEKDTILIPIDSIPSQGNSTWPKYNLTFKRPTDFVVEIKGKDNSRILVDSYYDSFYYSCAKKTRVILSNPSYENKESGIFNPEYTILSQELHLPATKQIIPLNKYESGKLLFGNGNPQSKDYNSLADFFVVNNNIEIRIPWALLNVRDPSSKIIIDDLYKSGIQSIKTDGFYIGGILFQENKVIESIDMNLYSWQEWDMPSYHERLKPSYFIMKEAFANLH